MIRTRNNTLLLATLFCLGANSIVYADGHGEAKGETKEEAATAAIEAVAADPSVTECTPSSAPIVPDGNVASKDELLAAQKAYKLFESSTHDYRDCLLILKANLQAAGLAEEELASKLAENLAADNASVDRLEGAAEEFNIAVRAFKAR